MYQTTDPSKPALSPTLAASSSCLEAQFFHLRKLSWRCQNLELGFPTCKGYALSVSNAVLLSLGHTLVVQGQDIHLEVSVVPPWVPVGGTITQVILNTLDSLWNHLVPQLCPMFLHTSGAFFRRRFILPPLKQLFTGAVRPSCSWGSQIAALLVVCDCSRFSAAIPQATFWWKSCCSFVFPTVIILIFDWFNHLFCEQL